MALALEVLKILDSNLFKLFAMIDPVSKPAPLKYRGYNVKRVGRLLPDAHPIFVHESAIDEILDYSAQDLRHEIGGFLVGGFFEDEQPYIEISNFLPALGTHSSSATLRITHDTWSQANQEVSERFPDEKIVGWQHTHPGLGVFLSGYDMFIHRNFFSEPWQVAMVVDPRRQEFAFFQWQNDQVVDCGFVCIPDKKR